MLLRWPQLELSFAGEVDGFAENPQRFLRRVEARRVFRFDEIEMNCALRWKSCAAVICGDRRVGGARCLQVGNEFHERVHREVAHVLRALLDGLDPALQFRLGPLVTGLAGAVDIQQRTAHVMVADLERALAFVGHVTIGAGHAGSRVDALVPHFKFRMLRFEHRRAGVRVRPVFKLLLVVVGEDVLDLQARSPTDRPAVSPVP